MKTKIFSLLFAIVASIGTMFASEQIGDLYYDLHGWDLTAEVTYQLRWDENNYSNLTTADIPATINYNDEIYSVTSIGSGAFSDCSSLTSVTIPNSVTSIGSEAFINCSGLTSVTIGNSVTSIGEWAFESCSSLTSVTIPNSVTSIGVRAFYGCSGLTSIFVEAGNTIYDSRDDCNAIIETASNILIAGCKNTIIPNSVTSIGYAAFYGCSGLTSVTIPNSVTSIGSSAFSGCSGLTSVTLNSNTIIDNSTIKSIFGEQVTEYILGDEITSIGNYAFDNCSSLTSVTIGNSVTSIGNGAFMWCSGLTSVTIGNSVTSIGERAFDGCSGLTSVTIPNSVTSIGWTAFYGCRSLTSVTIPNSVTSIGSSAFSGCSGLTSVVWNAKNCSNSGSFGSQVESFVFGNEVETIPASCCSGMNKLSSIEIPNSVTSIGDYAFKGCSSLTSITIPDSVTSIGWEAFSNCSGLTSIYVPCGEMARFKQMLGWKFEDKVKYAPLPYTITISATNGNVIYPQTICDDMLLNATPDYGYHFVKWSDGNTDNPRTFVLTQDTTFTAEFAKNTYTISTTSANPEWGSTAGDTAALYLDEVEISAIPNYGYHFVRWNDYNTSNPRIVSVTEDKTYTATFAKNVYSITKNAEHGTISGDSYAEYLDEVTLSVSSDYGYHFAQWSDGNTDNPRTITLTSDTTFTAQFAKNTYTISTTSANPEWGTTAGDTAALYLDEVEISAIPNYGYHFVRWNDYNTSNPRTVSVTEDKTYTATFAKNVYSITKNAEHGTISGNSSAEYLDFVTLTVTPDYGYHFTQWSDGLKDNPRIAHITQDTTFTAEFAYDRVGTCGKDLALVWSYDPANKVLTIGNAGEFTDNMQFGVEAPTEMEELVIGNNVTAIGENAFAGISTLKKVTIGESVKTIYDRAFYNCVNLETIFNYRPTPTNAYSTAFDGVDKFECILYVLPNSIDMYKNASVWRDFYYTYAIGAEDATVTTNDVQVEPQDNAATLTWPTSNEAFSYTIEITKDGVVFCRLTFNANGQLTGIAFAPGRDGQSMAPAAVMTANGLQFTVTGLDSNTQYGYNVTAKDANEQPIATYSGSFTTTSEGVHTGIDNTAVEPGITKILRNGEVLILRDGKTYTATGVKVE